MHDNDGYYLKPIDYDNDARYAIEDTIGPAFDRMARWMPWRIRARQYGPQIGALLAVTTVMAALAHEARDIQPDTQHFVVQDTTATLERSAQADGFSPMNLQPVGRSRKDATFDQAVDFCAIPLAMHALEAISAPDAHVQTTDVYTLILNQDTKSWKFTGYTDMVRALGPNVCSKVAELSDAAK